MDIKKLLGKIDAYSDYMVWFTATLGLFGSLYFSEVMKLMPCLLCWWQRILLYPIVVISIVGILRKDRGLAYYGIPLVVVGLPISLYQTLLQWGIIKESVITCSAYSSVSCSKAQINWLGFINIPLMALLAFMFITILFSIRIYLLRQQKP